MGAIEVADPVQAASKKIDAYWYQDGITEIGQGISAISIAGIALMSHRQMTTTTDWIGVGIGWACLAIGFSEGWVKKKLRERYSYPRIGYRSEVRGEPFSQRRKILAWSVLGVLLVLPFVILYMTLGRDMSFRTSFGWARWFPLIFGIGLMIASVYDYRRFHLPRLLVAGVLTMIAGAASSLLIDAAFLPWVVFGFAMAIIKIVSGTLALAELVRTVPATPE